MMRDEGAGHQTGLSRSKQNNGFHPERRWPLLLLAVASLTLVLLAAGLSNVDFSAAPLRSAGDPEAALTPESEAGLEEPLQNLPAGRPSDQTAAIAVALGAAFLVYSAIRWRRARFLVAFLLVLALMLFVGANWLYTLRDQAEADIPLDMSALEAVSGFLPEGEPIAPSEMVTNPTDTVGFFITIAVLLLFVGVALLVWRVIKPDPSSPRELVALGAENTLSAIRAGVDFRDAITRCYYDMSEALRQDRGLVRRQDMTPREFESSLLQTGLPDRHVQLLTRLFEAVRYGGQRVSQRDQLEAVAALEAIVAFVKKEQNGTTRNQGAQASANATALGSRRAP